MSRFGRSPGGRPQTGTGPGHGIRGYYRSPRHAEEYIDSFLDIRDASGKVVPGYGWIFRSGTAG